MSSNLESLARQVAESGRIEGLPDKHFINGRFIARGNESLECYDPGTGKPFARFAAGGKAEIEEAVEAAKVAFAKVWSKVVPAERGRILQKTAALIREKADYLTVVESLDSGKTLSEAKGDIANAARTFEYYAGAADKLQGDSFPISGDLLAYTVPEPMGVTAHIIPWNYPLAMLARGVAPALAAGCTIVAKPAEQTPMTALLIAGILQEAGLPDGVFNVVTGTGEEAGAPLAAHKDVAHITFTGSVETGGKVMQAAARNITQVTLELGGKSPAVVLADCDMENAINNVAGSIYKNAGQICSAGSRLVIERSIHDEFVDKLSRRAAQLRLGHGLRDPDVGPVNSQEQLGKVKGYLEDAKARGVETRAGGSVTADPETGLGWFVEPTIFDNLDSRDRLVQEEVFGPVLAVQVIDSLDEAIEVANDTEYGLVAGVFTKDSAKARRLAGALDAGQIFVNQWFSVGIEVPFGGNKKSGIGREKGMEGLRAYCKVKAVGERF